MKWLLLWMLGGTALVIAVACLLLLMIRGRLRQHHRVDRKVATGAPLVWMVDPRSPARLHRRLARVGTMAASVTEDQRPRRSLARSLGRRAELSPIGAAAADLTAQAVAADRQLARIAKLAAGARRAPLAELDRQVTGLERAAAQLAALNAESSTPMALAVDVPEIIDVQGQLDRLAQAQRELNALDAQAGLVPALANALTAPHHPPSVGPAERISPTTVLAPPETGAPSRRSST